MQHDTHHGHGASHNRAHGARGEHSEHGDALAAPASHAGHAGHVGHVAKFRRLFWIMLVLAVPAVGFNEMFAHVIGYHLTEVGWVPWVSPVLGAVIYFWGGWPLLTGAVSEIRSRKPGVMLLIWLAITVAFVASGGASTGLLSHELNFWWELALLVVIMLVGHWIEMRSLAQTTSALDSLAALLPDEAEKVVGDEIVKVAPADLVVGVVVIVRPGASVPADGRIVDGSVSMDEAMITGESKPVRRETGDTVVAGTIATDSGLRVQVTAIGEDTALTGIEKLVADAQASSSSAQRIADTAAGLPFWFALGATAITAIVWVLVEQPDAAVMRTITVLVIACPMRWASRFHSSCRLRLSVPHGAGCSSRTVSRWSRCAPWTCVENLRPRRRASRWSYGPRSASTRMRLSTPTPSLLSTASRSSSSMTLMVLRVITSCARTEAHCPGH